MLYDIEVAIKRAIIKVEADSEAEAIGQAAEIYNNDDIRLTVAPSSYFNFE